MRIRHILKNNSGFTLIEMVIVMAVFTVIIVITANSFDTVLKKSNIVSKSEETNIEGVIGLEVFRRDLAQTGFGLYTDTDVVPPSFLEAANTPASNYNDITGGIPRAIVTGDNVNVGDSSVVLTGSDYLVIKATTVTRSKVGQKWTYISGISPGSSKVWGTNDFTTSDYVIAVRQSFSNGTTKRKLIYDPNAPSSFSVTYKASAGSYADPFGPPSDDVTYYYYGIDGSNPRAPFNRTDYFVKRVATDVPKSCSPAAGVLYKATMNHADGKLTYIPLLDCVADMQVVLGWNTSGTNNVIDYYTNADGTVSSGSATPTFPVDLSDPAYIRQHLKLIKVYVLAQDGGYDSKYSNTTTNMVVGDPDLGEAALTNTIDLTGANYKNYRWKLYRLAVRPPTLN